LSLVGRGLPFCHNSSIALLGQKRKLDGPASQPLFSETGTLPRIYHINNKEIVIMKRLPFAILSVVALLGLATAIVWAAPTSQGELSDLELTDISWTPDTVYPGDEVTFTIRYENQGTDTVTVPEDTKLRFSIVVKTTDDRPEEVVAPVEGEIHEAADLMPKHTDIVTGTFTAPAEGTYEIVAVLEAEKPEKPAEEISKRTEPFVVKSALPTGVSRLFAGLGMFAAVMAIMAAGTEVVIDTLKVFIGMKRKVTALEAFETLKNELPGQLRSLGIDETWLEEFKTLSEELENTLTPVISLEDAYKRIKEGRFGEAFAAFEVAYQDVYLPPLKEAAKIAMREGLSKLPPELAVSDEVKSRLENKIDAVTLGTAGQLLENLSTILKGGVPTIEDKYIDEFKQSIQDDVRKAVVRGLDELKKVARTQMSTVLDGLARSLHLSNEVADRIEKHLEKEIDNVTLETVEDLLNTLFKNLREQAHQWTGEWLTTQVDGLLTQGRDVVCAHLDQEVLPALKGLGFDDKTVEPILKKALKSLEEQAREPVMVYVKSVSQLLQAVEERRNEIQSPLRKVYRCLRDSGIPFWGSSTGVVVGVVAAWLTGSRVWAVFKPAADTIVPLKGVLATLAAGLVAGLAVGLLVGWPLSKLGGRSLGDVLRYDIEKLYNSIKGSTKQKPEDYGKPDQETIKKIRDIGPTSLSKVLLEQEIRHKDAEATRLHWLRVISVFAGVILAYILQIDAARLLDAAVPGISAKINTFLNIPGDDLHAFWYVLPEKSRLTAGIILTGLAASAGSAFWHDQLDKLQSAKKQAEAAAKLVRQVKGMTETEE
jgi:hypothetical protein